MEISTTEFFWEEAPAEFGKDRRHCKREKHKFSHIKRKPGLPRLTLRATLSRKRKLHQFFLGNHDCMLKKHTVHQKFGRKISWKGQHAFIGEHTIYLQEECQCEKVFQRTQQFFYKIENNIFFLILIFISFDLVFYLWEESHWDCSSRVPFHLQVESCSDYKQSPNGTVLVAYKSRSPFTLYIPIFQRVFQRPFHTSIWRNISKPELYTSCLHSAPKVRFSGFLILEVDHWYLSAPSSSLKKVDLFQGQCLSCLSR